jgi:hypothetical protein
MIPPLDFRIRTSIVMNRPMDMEVTEIVRLVRLCQATSNLPQAGGLFDQDAYFVYVLEKVLVADQERVELERSKNKAR